MFLLALAGVRTPKPGWTTLPLTPALPKAMHTGRVPIGDITIWYAEIGPASRDIPARRARELELLGNQVPVLRSTIASSSWTVAATAAAPECATVSYELRHPMSSR